MGKNDKNRVQEKRLSKSKLRALGGIPILVLLLLVVTSPFSIWLLTPDNPLRIVVVDKTVPHPTYREHMLLFWVLNRAKTKPVLAPKPWTDDRDYLGYYPEKLSAKKKALTANLKREDLKGRDMLFIADTYGVYTEDLVDPKDYLEALDYSHKIYGGFEKDEVDAIMEFGKSGGDIVGEFNTFGSPTYGDERHRLEDLLGVEWTEWTGRYFEDLGDETEVPVWARRHWLQHYKKEWDFHGEGWMFSNEDTRIFVLQNGKDVGPHGMKIVDVARHDELMRGVLTDVPFNFWFDVIKADKGADVLANYWIDVTPGGQEIMKAFGLPWRFPAVVRKSYQPLRLYLAGDVSDMNIPAGMYNVAGIDLFKKMGRFYEHKKDQQAFFWEFYLPVFSNVLEVQAIINAKK